MNPVVHSSGCRLTVVRFDYQHLLETLQSGAIFFKGNVWLYLHTVQVFYHQMMFLAPVWTRQRGFRWACSDVQGLFHWEDDVFNLRQAVVLQDLGVWHGDVHTCHPGDWSVQIVEGGTWETNSRLKSHCFFLGASWDVEVQEETCLVYIFV